MTDTARLKPDTRAASWMGVSVFLNSWTPLAVALVGGTVGPFVFQFWVYVTMSLVWLIYLIWTHPGLVIRSDIWAWIIHQLPTRDGVLAMLNGFNLAVFVGATLFLDTALVTVITAAWLILFVAYRKQHDPRYQRMTMQHWLLLSIAMAGVALVTFSQAGGITTEGGSRLLFGVLLAAASAVCASWISFRFKMGTELYLSRYKDTTFDDPKGELACVLAVSIVTSAASILSGLLIGLIVFPGDTGPGTYLGGFVSTSVVWVIAIGIVSALGNIAFRYANLETTNLAVNAMQYLRPVLALVWLAWFATITVYRTDFLWVGAAAVISANALISFRSEDRAGFKWLILSLLGLGFVVYMRDEWFTLIPGYGWFPGFSDYYGVLGAGATVFVLSFRTSRLTARTASEEHQTYTLSHQLVTLCNDEPHRATILNHVQTIDTTRDIGELEAAYKYLTGQIEQAGLDRSEAAGLQASLATLVNSKQRGRNLAEPIVLVMLAFLVAGMAVFARTDAQAWPALVNDVVSMLLASVVTFMTVHLFDRRSERDYPLITDDGTVMFRTATRTEEHNRMVEQTISIGIGFAIIGIYIWLMILKWLPV